MTVAMRSKSLTRRAAKQNPITFSHVCHFRYGHKRSTMLRIQAAPPQCSRADQLQVSQPQVLVEAASKVEDATVTITAPVSGRLEQAEASSVNVLGNTGSDASVMIRSLRDAR